MDEDTSQPAQGGIVGDASRSVASEADTATEIACKMLLDGAQARAPRFDQIRKNEDMYNGVNPPALRGRSNIPFDQVVMGGFLDTLVAGVQDPISVSFKPTREQDKMAADKITAMWQRESAPDRANWDDKLLDGKFLAALSGRGFYKMYFESAPRFKHDLLVCDHYDMITEVNGGGHLDRHLYKFQMNIFRTREELLSGAESGYYDKGQVRNLIMRGIDQQYIKQTADVYNFKATRYAAFGIDINMNNFVGQPIYRLTEGVISYKGKWWYILFSFELRTWIRFQPLEDVFEHAKEYPGRGPWSSWATHKHPFLFWSKAPADDIRPIAYTMKKIVNLTVDNLEKRNWDMKAYNPKVFTNPVDLLSKQDGIVKATVRPGENIASGIFQFQTPDTTGITINMVQWLDNFLGTKTGINNDTQGQSKTDTLGIAVSNIQQASKRLTLDNRRFKQSLCELGVMFDFGCYEHLREDYAVKVIGPRGARWEEQITRKDTERDFTISVVAGDDEVQKTTADNNRKEIGFQSIEKNPQLLGKLNPQWLLSERLKFMGYTDEQVRIALDTENDGDPYSMAEAAQAIQDCLEGKDLYRMYRNATVAFVAKILNFCEDNFPLYPKAALQKMSKNELASYTKDLEKNDKLMAYAMAHMPIAQQNMVRKATMLIASIGAQNIQQKASAGKQPQPAAPSLGQPEVPNPSANQPIA